MVNLSDDGTVPDVMMWQVREGGRWSRVHMLNDEQTTLCGIRIPVHHNADYGHGEACKNCARVRGAVRDLGTNDNPR